MTQFNYTEFLKEGGIEKNLQEAGDFGNDPQDRYNYARKFTADLPDTARTEQLLDNLEDALEDYKMTDDVIEFDRAFVEIMIALGKENELMEGESLINPEAEEIEATDLDAAADYFDSLAENDDALDEVINEGTWSYGSENQMIKALEEMNAMMMHSDPRQLKAGLDAMDNALYRIFGDDDFHDSLGAAQDFAAKGDLDRAKNALTDAMAVGEKMIKDIHGMEDDLEENDMALDEIIGEEKESLTQQIMKKYPKKYKDEKAVKAAARELMKDPKYKANRGIFPVLYALLKGK